MPTGTFLPPPPAGVRPCSVGCSAGWLALIASFVAVGYPLLAGRFERSPSIGQLAVILLANLIVTIAASALAALFARPLVYDRAVSVLGLSLCAVLTVPLRLPGSAIATAGALDAEHARRRPRPPHRRQRLGPDLDGSRWDRLRTAVALPRLTSIATCDAAPTIT